MKVLLNIDNGKGITFASSCAVNAALNKISDEFYSMEICRDDFAVIQSDGRIQRIKEDSSVDKDTEACQDGTCCKTCVISEEGEYPEADPNQAMKVLLNIDNGKGITFAMSCAVNAAPNEISDEFYSMEICRDDFAVIQSNGRIQRIKEDSSVDNMPIED